jgi:hypothetical protein
MGDPLAKAKFYHHRAVTMETRAKLEENKQRRQIMISIADLYYLLHDKLVELSQLEPPG